MKVSLTMALTVLDSLPFPRLASDGVVGRRLVERALRLTCTAPEMNALWDEFSQAGIVPRRKVGEIPGAIEVQHRLLLRSEIEAELAILYGLTSDELGHVLDTFPIVQKDDEKAYSDFRTKILVLDRYRELSRPSGANVISLPVKPAFRPQHPITPAVFVPDLVAVAANAWTRPHTMERGEIQTAILAVLKANGAPMERRQARLASLLCLEPHLVGFMLDKTEKAQWVRVVGDDAKKDSGASIDVTFQEWGAALTGLRGRARLIENLRENTWAVGTGTGAIDTTGWPDGRASFIANLLRRLQVATQVESIVLRLPPAVQQWFANAA